MRQLFVDKKKMRFVLFVLLVAAIFLAFIWWIFSPVKETSISGVKTGGLNTILPGAHIKNDSARDKLSFYAAAAQDSGRRREQIQMDPYRREADKTPGKKYSKGYEPVYFSGTSSLIGTDDLEAKLAALQKRIANADPHRSPLNVPATEVAPTVPKAAVSSDPDIEAINEALNKLLAIQHPQTSAESTNQRVYAVLPGTEEDTSYFGKRRKDKVQVRFPDRSIPSTQSVSAISVLIADDQILQNGSLVKLELGSAIVVGGKNIPVGTPVFGLAGIEPERLRIHLSSIRFQDDIFPVSMDVFDMDGLEGIYVQGSAIGDAAKESAGESIQAAGVSASGYSLPTQAVAAGIGVAKKMLTRKIKQVRISVAAGYRVFLYDHKQMSN